MFKKMLPMIFGFIVTVTGYGNSEDVALNNCINMAVGAMREYKGDYDLQFKRIIRDHYTYGDVVECHATIEVE